ncbi:unnamed protein product [Vitrella brassicaformis CCMP3155]|uniref:Uncharacterized protein n=1 Tax=Vitrella brassicaformis (strain CCMP3155) TaxID=1169540 RepID=A0A0G4EJR2_VITBC|nr:unnamed protein product [Vitrella brassicaformis CCMP3155]|eukprot:CEL97670.1 unnamed protein product [Vitrella brassicaformis CCMP3155]
MPSPAPAALVAAAAAAPVDLMTASAAKKTAASKEQKVRIAEEARRLIEGPKRQVEHFIKEHHHFKGQAGAAGEGARGEARELREELFRARDSIDTLAKRQKTLVELVKERDNHKKHLHARIAALELELRAYRDAHDHSDYVRGTARCMPRRPHTPRPRVRRQQAHHRQSTRTAAHPEVVRAAIAVSDFSWCLSPRLVPPATRAIDGIGQAPLCWAGQSARQDEERLMKHLKEKEQSFTIILKKIKKCRKALQAIARLEARKPSTLLLCVGRGDVHESTWPLGRIRGPAWLSALGRVC